MPNVKQTIQKHNRKVASPQTTSINQCNCVDKSSCCPMNGDCMRASVVYMADITSDNTTVSYIGMTGGPFKTRYNNHLKSFRHIKYEKETELSKHIWALKNASRPHTVKWSFISTCPARMTSRGQCTLCLQEKFCIITLRSKHNLLNKRT